MRYYYHEKERIEKLFKGLKNNKVPVVLYLKDRNNVILNNKDLAMIQTYSANNYKKMKPLFRDKKTLSDFLEKFTENLNLINNSKQNRSKK